jgi:Pyruvate/2-oxoacid:ferredoxin oxidoreductase delta subunit
MTANIENELDLNNKELLKNLIMAFGVPEKYVEETKYLPEIMQRIITASEVDIITKLGNKSYNLAQAAELLELSESEAGHKLEQLQRKGVIMAVPDLAKGELTYTPTTMILLHDMTLLNTREDPERFGEDFLELWDKFYKEVMVPTFSRMEKHMKDAGDSVFRVIPVEETITKDHANRILSYETVAGIIQKANNVSLQPCICRTRTHGKNCSHMVEDACMGFDMMAHIAVERGHARMVSKEEALEQLKKTSADGLVHLSGNTSDGLAFICSCCACCCGVLYALVNAGTRLIAQPSRYQARVESELCCGCETCVGFCNFKAISMKDDTARIDAAKCWGCGVCAFNCPEEAIKLDNTREEDFIPEGNFLLKMMERPINYE